VRVIEDALVMDVIRPASTLVSPSALNLPSGEGERPQEKAMAEQLIEHLRAPFDTADFTDEYQAALRQLVEAKLTGVDLEADVGDEPVGTPVIDLMARLQESLASAGTARKRGRAPARAPKKAASRRRSA
jgi:DNA end-binding protein Ku